MPCTSLILQSIPSYNSRLDEMLQTAVAVWNYSLILVLL